MKAAVDVSASSPQLLAPHFNALHAICLHLQHSSPAFASDSAPSGTHPSAATAAVQRACRWNIVRLQCTEIRDIRLLRGFVHRKHDSSGLLDVAPGKVS